MGLDIRMFIVTDITLVPTGVMHSLPPQPLKQMSF